MSVRRTLIMGLAMGIFASGSGAAEEATFLSEREAMQWLARELPQLTLANPKYQSKTDGTVSQWLTKSVRFSRDHKGPVRVAMDESYTQTKAAVTTPGCHSATFSLAGVDISDLTQPDDTTPAGEPARGILFTCKTPGCIAAVWGGKASHSEKTDIYIQEEAPREKVLAAFRYLAAHSD